MMSAQIPEEAACSQALNCKVLHVFQCEEIPGMMYTTLGVLADIMVILQVNQSGLVFFVCKF